MSNQLISVIIPTYNRANLIGNAISSVLNQTYQNFEIIVVDDGSTDNTKEVVYSFNDKRINYIKLKHTGLSPLARNKGITLSNGKYIALLDSDDMWFPNKLEKQIKAFKEYNEILVVATNFVYFSEQKSIIISFLYNENKRVSYKEMLKMCQINNSSVLIKKSVFNKIGYKDENCRLMSDYDFWLRVLQYRDNSILILKDILTKSKIHRDNTFLKAKSFLEKFRTWKYIYNKHKDYNHNYIENNLRWRLEKFRFFRSERNLFHNKISLLSFLKRRPILFNDKFLSVLRFLYFNYYRKRNKIFTFLFKNFYFIIKRIIKSNFVI